MTIRKAQGSGKAVVRFTTQALQSMKIRGIKRADVVKALADPSANTVDAKTGHVVSRFGDVRVVSRRTGDAPFTVLTTLRADEVALKAG